MSKHLRSIVSAQQNLKIMKEIDSQNTQKDFKGRFYNIKWIRGATVTYN